MKTSMIACSVLLCTAAAAVAVDPRACVYELTLDKAMPNGTELTVHLNARDGAFVSGVAETPRFTRAMHNVNAGGLTYAQDVIRGELAVTINSDGYIPPGWKSVPCRFTLDLTVNGETVSGKFSGNFGEPSAADAEAAVRSGVVCGRLVEPPNLNGLLRVRISMEAASGAGRPGGGSFGARGFADVLMKDGKAIQGLIRGHGGNPINYFEADITKVDLTLKNGRLIGSMTAEEKGSRKQQGAGAATPYTDAYVYSFDAPVVGHIAGGVASKVLNGVAQPGAPFRAEFAPVEPVEAAAALYYLVLSDAVFGDHQLIAYLPATGGAVGDGVGFSGRWNHTFHDVVSQGLKIEGNRLTGKIDVTLNPDPYVPSDRKPVPCSYTIDAVISDGGVAGTYEGTCRDVKVAGKLLGELRVKATIPEPVKINVKLDNGACNGPPWHRRCYIGFVSTDGKADSGGISNNKGGFQGTFTSAEVLELSASTFRAVIKANVHTSGQVLKGDYTFHLDGKVIGNELVGKVDTELGGEIRKRGTDFMGSFSEAK